MQNSNYTSINISNDFLPYISKITNSGTTDEKVSLSLAIGLFLSKEITLAKAAELSRKTVWQFIDTLDIQNIPWGEYTDDSGKFDEVTLNKLKTVRNDE